jgi:hypothetical protein
MKKVCHNSSSVIYEDGDNWVWKHEFSSDRVIPKTDDPLLPLSAVIKHEFTEDDKPTLDKLRKKALNPSIL